MLHDSGNKDECISIVEKNMTENCPLDISKSLTDISCKKDELEVNKMSYEERMPLEYFEESIKLSTFQVYLTRPKIAVGEDGIGWTFFMMHHGAGSCGMSFSCLAKEITLITHGTCGVLTYDIRGHGQSDPILKDGVLDLRLEELCKDFVKVVTLVKEHFGWHHPLEIILVGHSLGGSVLSHVAKNQLLSNILGCVVIDMVEGSAVRFFSTMMYHLSKRPKMFHSIQEGIDWHLKNKIIKNAQSASISVPMLLKEQTFEETSQKIWVWRVDLNATKQFWHDWFHGLSECFLAIPSAKLLILSSTDRLDKTLMIGQMQGKFQLVAFQDTGHFVHEDAFQLTANTLVSFWKRNQKRTDLIKTL